MKKFILLIVGGMLLTSAVRSQTCSIVAAKAFAQQILPGNIPTEGRGTTGKMSFRTERTIYFVSSCRTAARVSTIRYGAESVKFEATEIKSKKIMIGNGADGKAIYMRAGAGQRLYKVVVLAMDHQVVDDVTAARPITLRVYFGKRLATKRIPSVISLSSPERY